MNNTEAIILFVSASCLFLKIVANKIPNVGNSPTNKSICIQPSPSLSCPPPEYSFIEMLFNATNKYVNALIDMILIFFVPKQTSEVVIVKTIDVSIIPFGAKKCPISPFKNTVKVASPNAVLLFIFFVDSVVIA